MRRPAIKAVAAAALIPAMLIGVAPGAHAVGRHIESVNGRVPAGVTLNDVPAAVGAGEAVTVIPSPAGLRIKWVSATPLTCNGGGKYAAFYARGTCRLSLYVNNKLVKRISTVVKPIPVGDADAAVGVISLTFDANASKISKVSKALIADFRIALVNAPSVMVMGHANNDGGRINSAWAVHVSMRRAQKVAAYLVAAGAKAGHVTPYWYANTLLVSKTSERDNRRVVVAWIED